MRLKAMPDPAVTPRPEADGANRSGAARGGAASPFDLSDEPAYLRWRDAKLREQPRDVADLIVDVDDPRKLDQVERAAIVQRCRSANMAVYRGAVTAADKELPRRLGLQLGLRRLDANWLADEDGISRITVATQPGERGEGGAAYIPYTDRAIKWHTDGYYHPQERRIHSMILHCVSAAAEGGDTTLMDHERAYIALRDAEPRWVRALMAGDAMTIPARMGEAGVARAAQAGPVFSVDAASGALHMRYTARTRSVEWKADACTQDAAAFLRELLDSDVPHRFRLRLQPGMGVVCHNVLHDRGAFVDDPLQPRLLYRARYLDRIEVAGEAEA
jgi:alpha-ketoglutarate-dependent taurine dioxygenase